jgi:thiol-disulfide isomerase/thioredoxin
VKNLFILLSLLISVTLQATEIPNFWIRNLDGERFDTRRLNGRPFVVSFFFVACVPCRKEIPELYSSMKETHPETPLLFISPIKEDSEADIARFSEALGVPRSHFYRDSFSAVSRKFFSREKIGFPTIIGGRDGKQLFRFPGLPEGALDTIRKELK